MTNVWIYLVLAIFCLLNLQRSLAFPRGMGRLHHLPPASSTPKAKLSAHPNSNRSSDEKDCELTSKVISSMKSCYQAVALSAVVDTGTLWSARRLASQRTGVLPYLAVLWKVSWSISVYTLSRITPTDIVPPHQVNRVILSACRTISPVFRAAAWLVSATAISDTARILMNLQVALSGWIRPGLFTIFCVLAVAIRVFSDRQAQQQQQQALGVASLIRDNETGVAQTAGLITARNMALCSASLCIQGAVLLAVALTESSSVVPCLVMLTGVPTPILTASHLWRLRRAVLLTVFETTTGTTPQHFDKREAIDLNDAQIAFYSAVAGNFRVEASIKVLAGAGRFLAGK